ncbi:MAG: Omp28-related outer membrane protein [Bacteroidales bacterium]|nr:Omp28-related outer membrane protein [Bacteroidales bacterium]
MKKNAMVLAAAAMLFAACDKIAEGEYTTFAGISATWSEGPALQATQRAYVEKYTGPSCINCPLADVTIENAHESLGESLVAVSINHWEGMGMPFAGQPDMRTDDGTAWDKYFGVSSLPSAYINRNTEKRYRSSMEDILAGLQSAVGEQPSVALEVSAEQGAGGGIAVVADIQFEKAVAGQLTLTLALIEDSLRYKQLTPDNGVVDDYVHNHMLRDVMTDLWGADVDAEGRAGERRRAVFSEYNVKNADIKLENCHVVAFVSERGSKRVLNSAQCTITLAAAE